MSAARQINRSGFFEAHAGFAMDRQLAAIKACDTTGYEGEDLEILAEQLSDLDFATTDEEDEAFECLTESGARLLNTSEVLAMLRVSALRQASKLAEGEGQ